MTTREAECVRQFNGSSVVSWVLGGLISLLLIVSPMPGGAQYVVAKWIVQFPIRAFTGLWVLSTFHGLDALVVLCVLDVWLINRLVRLLSSPKPPVRLVTLVGLGLQFISVVACP